MLSCWRSTVRKPMAASARRFSPILPQSLHPPAEASHCRVASTHNYPKLEGGQQVRNCHRGECLDDIGVATGPANWLDEDSLETAPESSLNAGATPSCPAKSQSAGHLFHVEGMSIILDDVVEGYGELEDTERTTKHCGSRRHIEQGRRLRTVPAR